MRTTQKKLVTGTGLAAGACYVALTLLVWGIFVFDRGISALDEPNQFERVLSQARYGPLAQLFFSTTPPGRYFVFTPYAFALWSGHPTILLQLVYAAAWLSTGVFAFVLARQLLANRLAAYLAGALTLTATGDFLTDYLGIVSGYLAVAHYFASVACLIQWWKQRSVVWAFASGALLLLSIWTAEYAIAPIVLTPLLIWVLDRFRVSKRLIVTALWWYTLVFASVAVLLTGILRPGDHRNEALSSSMTLGERIWQTLNFFLYNFAPYRWVLRAIPPWFMGYAPIFPVQLRIALALGGALLFLVVALLISQRRAATVEVPSAQASQYLAIGAVCLLMALVSNATMASLGTDYFVRSHLVSRVWASIAIALGSYALGVFLFKRTYAALVIPMLFVGCGIYSAIERQDYQLGLWKHHQAEVRSIVEQVPAVKPGTVFLLLVPPGAHPLLATSNVNYLPVIYGDDTLQQRVFYWGRTWQHFSRCTAETKGFACQLTMPWCGAARECPILRYPYDKIVLLVYSPSQNRFVLQHEIPAGILQGVELLPGAYNPAARIEQRPLPAYAQSLLYDTSSLAARLPAEPEPQYVQSPLVRVADQLGGSLTADVIDPWRSEQMNGQTVIWLGPEHNYGLDGWIWSDKDQNTRLSMRVAPGPARQDLLRTLQLEVTNGAQHSTQYRVFAAPALYSAAEVHFDVSLRAGRNDFRLSVLDKVTVSRQANGNTRPPLVRLDGIVVEAAAASPSPASPNCLLTIDEGWYGYEHAADDWWRWTEGRGITRILVERDATAIIRGDIYAAQPPNTVSVLVNGEQKAALQATSNKFMPFEVAPIKLKAGMNEVAFISSKSAVQIGNDSRLLGIALRNLQILTGSGDESNCITRQR